MFERCTFILKIVNKQLTKMYPTHFRLSNMGSEIHILRVIAIWISNFWFGSPCRKCLPQECVREHFYYLSYFATYSLIIYHPCPTFLPKSDLSHSWVKPNYMHILLMAKVGKNFEKRSEAFYTNVKTYLRNPLIQRKIMRTLTFMLVAVKLFTFIVNKQLLTNGLGLIDCEI